MVWLCQILHETGLPEYVCDYCTERIISFYEYFKNVLENQIKLHEINVEYLTKDETLSEGEDPIVDVKIEAIDEEDTLCEQEEFSENRSDDESEEQIQYKVTSKKKKKRKPKSNTTSEIDPEIIRLEDERIQKYISFKCMICPTENLTNLQEWKSHMRHTHSDPFPVIICCDRKLRDRKRILDHISFHHEAEPQFECETCGKKFMRKPYLISHMKTHKILVDKNFQCEKCPEKFFYRVQLLKHQLVHMTSEEQKLVKLYDCKQCGRQYAAQANLNSHIRRVHKKLSTLVCHICAKIFNKKERLTAHVLYKHTENPPKHQCEHCGIELANNDTYRRHVKVYHTNQGSFSCDICGKIMVTEMQLKSHKRFTHETERKYACEYCQKAFKRQIELTEHLTIHLGGSLYYCIHCDRRFNSKSNMQSHVKKCKSNPQILMEIGMQE